MIDKTSGELLSFENDIEAEFGQNSGRSLGRYRTSHPDFRNKNLGELSNLPLDTGMPTSGEIKFSDFYQKRLNVVVDMYTTGNSNYGLNVYTQRFNQGSSFQRPVGGFKEFVNKNGWRGGKKIIIHINKTFGSAGATAESHVAVDIGDIDNGNANHWPTATLFQIDVGGEGLVGGRGGKGGDAGNEETAGENGGRGTSGMKIHESYTHNGQNFSYEDEISGESRIFGGGGGGGSGSGAEQNDWGDKNSAGGGGGGGGAGIPAGADGSAPGSGEAGGTNVAPDYEQGGDGGNGGDNAEAEGGTGGNGGNRSESGENASGGRSREHGNGEGGEAGERYVFY